MSELQRIPFPPGADDYPTVGLPFIMRELGQRNHGLPRQLRYVTLLVADLGFPPPLPTLVGKGEDRHLTKAVVKDSQWRRAPVEAWIEDYLPPANAAALDQRAAAAAADDMDHAAGNLRLVSSREHVA